MSATNFIANAYPETFVALKLGFGLTLSTALPFTGTEPSSQDDMANAAGALIDILASALARRPGCLTLAGRQKLTRGVGAELEKAIGNNLADKLRPEATRAFTGETVQ